MTAFDFVAELAERRVYLSRDGDALKYRAPEGAVDGALRAELQQHKAELLKAMDGHEGYRLMGPLSFNQQSLYFVHLLEPASAAYNLALTARFLSPVDPEKMRGAVEDVLRCHGQLRTTFGHVELAGTFLPVQLLHDELPPSFERFDASGWTEGELSERLRGFYRVPFDLEKGPTVRAGLFARGESDSILLLVFHHIVTDALSLNLIVRDLAAAYRGVRTALPRTEPKSEYVDFALAQRRELEGPVGKAHLDYWVTELTPASPPLEWGDGSRRPAVRRSAGATHTFHLGAGTYGAIERAAQEQGITSFALLLAVFQWLLYDRTGRRDLTIGVPVMARGDRRFEDTVGYFINPVPLRSRRPDKLRFRDHAGMTALELRRALDHRDAPFAAVVEKLGGVRDTAHTPVFQVMFHLLSRKTLGDMTDLLYPVGSAAAVDIGGLKATACALDQQEGQFDLTLELIDDGNDILGLLKYCTDLFSDAEAADLAAAFRARLDAALKDPEAAVFAGAEGGAARARPDAEAPAVAVSASFTAEVLQEFMEFWFEHLGWPHRVRFAPYNQVFQELLSPSSLIRANRSGHSIVLVRLEDLSGGNHEKLEGLLDELLAAAGAAAKGMSVPLTFVLCPSSPEAEESLRGQAEAVGKFLEALRTLPGVTVLAPADVLRRYPVEDYYEPIGETMGRIPFTRPYFAALATAIVRSLHAQAAKPVKALAVDCDGTLWSGVAAEDGATGVTVGPWQRAFQVFLLEQHQAGVVLCLCSKNQEADVWAVFDRHPDMLLRREHFPFWKINWEPKSANLRALAREINIGTDAIAFLDDSPIERAEVRARCPSVLCLEFPEAWEERTAWLEHVWLLDHGRVTAEDRKRQEHYRSEQIREGLKRGAGSLSEFLEKLDLKVDLNPAEAADHDRLAQLSMRTNQFNTTTLRLTPQEVAGYATTPGLSAHVARVRDRFGDYGLVGAMLARAEGQVFRVDGMFLSCRALGRGVEFRMASYLASRAIEALCREIVFPVKTTERNEPARAFLARLGELCGGTRDGDDGLRLDAERLAGFRYDSLPAEDGPAEASAPQDASGTPDEAAGRDRELFAAIAGELRSAEAVLSAAERRTLALLGPSGSYAALGPSMPPKTETEKIIADVWKRVLGLAEVNTQAKFFEIGGTSLLMARIAIELKRDHGFDLSIMDMFQYPAIADLAGHLDRSGPRADPAGQAESAAVRQREALDARNLPSGFQRLKKVRG